MTDFRNWAGQTLVYFVLIIAVFLIGYHTGQVQRGPKTPPPWWTDSINVTVSKTDPIMEVWIDDIYLMSMEVDHDKWHTDWTFYKKR